MSREERKATSTELFAGSRPSSYAYNSHHDSSSFDASRLELMQRAQRAEAEELERRRSMRWSVLQSKHQTIKPKSPSSKSPSSKSPSSVTSTATSSTTTGIPVPSKRRSVSPTISIRKKVITRSPNARSIRKKVMMRSPYASTVEKEMKGDVSEAPSEVSSLASSKPKEDVPVPPEVEEDEICSSATAALGSLSFLTSWYTGNAIVTDTTNASTVTVDTVPDTPSTTNAAENVAKLSASPPAWNPYDPKKSSLHAFPSSPYWDNKTKTSSTTTVVEKKIPVPKPTPPGVTKTINNIKKKILRTPPSPNASPPQVVVTATPSSTIGTGGTFDSEDMDDYSLSSESLTLFQLGHLMEGGSRNSGRDGVHVSSMDKKKDKLACASCDDDDDIDVVLFPVQPWTNCAIAMVAVGAVLSVAFLLATGSLFWTLTSRYNASMGPVLTATLPPLQRGHEQPVQAVKDPTVGELPTPRVFTPVPRKHRPAQDMIEHAVSQRLNSRGIVGGPAVTWTWRVPVLNEQVSFRNKNAPPDSLAVVSATLEQLRYGSLAREGLASSSLALLPKPAFELRQQLEQAMKYKPAAVLVTEFAYSTVDVTEHSSSTETQTHNEVPESVTSATPLPNDLNPLDQEEMIVSADLDNYYDTEDMSTFLQDLDPSDEIELQMISDPVDEEEMTVSAALDNDYDTEDMRTLLQQHDPSDETDLQIMVSEHHAANMDPIVEETTKPAVSLPKCFAYDRWNQTMLSDEASQEFVLWAHFGFWRRLFTSPTFAPLSPLQDAWPDFSANLEMMRFLTIMDPEFSIIPGESCRSWDSLVDLVPSVKRIETLQDAVDGRDDDGSHGDFFLHVPLVDVVGDFLRQKGQQMQKVSNVDVVGDFLRQKKEQVQKANNFAVVVDSLRQKKQQMQKACNFNIVIDSLRQKKQQMQKASNSDVVGNFLRLKKEQIMQKPSNYQYLEEQQPRVYY